MIPVAAEAVLLALAGYALGLGIAWAAYVHLRYQSRGWK